MPEKQIEMTAAEGKTLRVIADNVRVLAAGEDTGGTYELFEFHSPRDSGPPLHSHPWSEAYIILQGEVEVAISDKTIIAAPGCFLNIPAGIIHSYKTLSDSARFILITNLVGAQDFFNELDQEVGEAIEDVEKIVGIAVRHGFSVPQPTA